MEKYLVAASGDSLDSKVSGRFGHSAFFLIVDPQTMEYEVFPGIQNEESGQVVNRFLGRGITKVIVGNIGPSTFYGITSFGYSVYLCRNMLVKEAVKKVNDGETEPLKEPTLDQSIHTASKEKTGRRGGRGRGMRW
jgi:predicted Fe-Mo cluster-binding NifX family protein